MEVVEGVAVVDGGGGEGKKIGKIVARLLRTKYFGFCFKIPRLVILSARCVKDNPRWGVGAH